MLESGKGKLTILEDALLNTNENMALEFDAEMFGDEWFQYSIRFNSSYMTRIAIAICDLGGSALFDNVRLFKVADAKEVTDPYKSETGSTEAPTATVKPTAKPTTKPTTVKPTSTPTVELPTDPSETDPTDPSETDPTQPEDPTDPTQPADHTQPVADDEDVADTDGDAAPKGEKTPWLFIGIGVGAAVLIAGGIFFSEETGTGKQCTDFLDQKALDFYVKSGDKIGIPGLSEDSGFGQFRSAHNTAGFPDNDFKFLHMFHSIHLMA
jgi:hypothetical protein